MYVPAHFVESRLEELQRIIREHPLGALVTHTAAGLDANHVPFALDTGRGDLGTLIAHVARANRVWTDVVDGDRVLVIFRGVQGYISPNWYPSKHVTHRMVPTWSYEVVHVHGRIRVRDDAAVAGRCVARLTHEHEATQPHPWKLADAPAEYLAEKIGQIVAVEVDIDRFEGKRKLNQHHSSPDFDGAVDALEQAGRASLAAAMRRVRDAQAAPQGNQPAKRVTE